METLHERATRLVRDEVYCCISSLVEVMAGKCQDDDALDLMASVPDYESAALDAGWKESPSGVWVNEGMELGYETAVEVCTEERIEPYEREVFEHWCVSQWLARRLDELGEKVCLDFYGLCIWARTTTGQAIAIDACIEQLAEMLQRGAEK